MFSTAAAVAVLNNAATAQTVTVNVAGYLPVGLELTDAFTNSTHTVTAGGELEALQPVALRVVPAVLPLRGRAPWVTFEVSGGAVDLSTVLLNGVLRPIDPPGDREPGKVTVDGDAVRALTAPGAAELTLTHTGRLADGPPFEGSVTVKLR